MASIVSAETAEAIVSGSTVRYLFRYVLDIGETHERRVWVHMSVDGTAERTARSNLLLDELAQAEVGQLLGDTNG